MSLLDFRLLISDFCPLTSDLAIAVSGGADSMALLHMLWTQKTPEQTIVALTVDHGLRADSKREAEAVAAYCDTLNINLHILQWHDAKPETGLQAKARTARRDLLLDQCHALNVTDLFLAHQADDQIETYLQRLARGAGPQALGGMKPQTTQRGVTLHRPLLNIRRAALRDYCVQQAIPFHDDPSNNDLRFERIRWRQAVQQLEQVQPGFGDGVLRSQRRAREAGDAIQQQAYDWINRYRQIDDDTMVLPRIALITQSQPVIVMILRTLLKSTKPYGSSLERLEQWVAQAFGDQNTMPAETALTLGNWWLQIQKETLTFKPAPIRRFTKV